MTSVKKNYFKEESRKEDLPLHLHWLYLCQFVFL